VTPLPLDNMWRDSRNDIATHRFAQETNRQDTFGAKTRAIIFPPLLLSSPARGEEEYGKCPAYSLVLLGERGFDFERILG